MSVGCQARTIEHMWGPTAKHCSLMSHVDIYPKATSVQQRLLPLIPPTTNTIQEEVDDSYATLHNKANWTTSTTSSTVSSTIYSKMPIQCDSSSQAVPEEEYVAFHPIHALQRESPSFRFSDRTAPLVTKKITNSSMRTEVTSSSVGAPRDAEVASFYAVSGKRKVLMFGTSRIIC